MLIPTIDKVETGKKLKRIMERNQITPNDIMKYLNLSCIQTVYRWLEGLNVPSIDNLYALSDLLNVSMDELIVGSKTDDRMNCYGVFVLRMRSYYNSLVKSKAA